MGYDAPAQASRAERIAALLQQISTIADPGERAQVEELVQALLALYGEGLARVLDLAAQSPAASDLISSFGDDELVGALLALHGLHPDPLETRVARAIERVRAVAMAQGASIALVDLRDGVAHVRLSGGCQSCAGGDDEIQAVIERTIYAAAPDVEGVEFTTNTRAARPLITLTPTRRAANAPRAATREAAP